MAWPRSSLPGLRDLDLTLGLRRGLRSLTLAVLAGGGCGLVIGLADAGPLLAAVPEVQRQLLRNLSLDSRLLLFLHGALNDELLLRMVGMSGLVWLLAVLGGGVRRWTHPAAIVLTAAVLWPLLARGYLLALDWTALTLVRELVLHVGAGLLWGWLYWRHGWLAALVGHCAAQQVLQPSLSLFGGG